MTEEAEVVWSPSDRLFRSPILLAHAPIGPAKPLRTPVTRELNYLHTETSTADDYFIVTEDEQDNMAFPAKAPVGMRADLAVAALKTLIHAHLPASSPTVAAAGMKRAASGFRPVARRAARDPISSAQSSAATAGRNRVSQAQGRPVQGKRVSPT